MSVKRRIPLEQAEELADQVLAFLAPACERIVVAGSVRRRAETCGDIEILAIPRLSVTQPTDLFGAAVGIGTTINWLDNLCNELRERGMLGNRLDSRGRPAWGSKMKRAVYKGFALDIFTADAEQWGLVLAIRTGPSEFSNAIVTQENLITHDGVRGLLPAWAEVRDGSRLHHKNSGERMATPDEEAFLRLCRCGWLEPTEREAWLAEWKTGRGRVVSR